MPLLDLLFVSPSSSTPRRTVMYADEDVRLRALQP